MLDETHKGFTTQLPIEHVATLKRTALELEVERGRAIGSADLIRFAVAELVARIRSDPRAAIASLGAWFERGELATREQLEEEARAAALIAANAAEAEAASKAGRAARKTAKRKAGHR